MASYVNNTAKNTMLDALAALITHVSVYTNDPASSGSETTGGSYARLPVTWAASSGGVKALTGSYTFQMPAGTTAGFIGFHNALTAGTFYGGFDIVDESGNGAWQYTLTSGQISL